MANTKLGKSLRNSIAAEAKKVGTHNTSKTIQKKPVVMAKPTKAKTTTAKPKAVNVKKATNMAAKAHKKHTTAAHHQAANQGTTSAHKAKPLFELPNNPMIGLAHNKLHNMVETHYNFCETCLENLQKVNDNMHDYLNQLVEINNVSSLIKLNLTYLSTAPTRYQEMIAQNKNIFGNFFKFAKVEK